LDASSAKQALLFSLRDLSLRPPRLERTRGRFKSEFEWKSCGQRRLRKSGFKFPVFTDSGFVAQFFIASRECRSQNNQQNRSTRTLQVAFVHCISRKFSFPKSSGTRAQ
jgi:hypothetical protein